MPGTVGIVHLGGQPGPEQDFQVQLVGFDQPQHRLRIGLRIIQPDQTEFALPAQDLEIFQNFLVAGIDRAVAPVGMLPVAEPGIAYRPLETAKQVAGFLLNGNGGRSGAVCLRAAAGHRDRERSKGQKEKAGDSGNRFRKEIYFHGLMLALLLGFGWFRPRPGGLG